MNPRNEKFKFGTGYWTKANSEDCYLYRRGMVEKISDGVSQIIESDFPEEFYTHLRDHSRKPDEIRDRIAQLVGDVPKIELFARGRYSGWDVWGNQVPKIGGLV